ncbi:MAG: bifunctional nuclease family protein [Candidatus Sumerlaeaceae bacterium]|nr:bifunctional nuclease family protein [Candidatus Sumerlaeaceae bacterium]
MAENFVRVELREYQIVDDMSHTQVIILGEVDGPRSFPIFIGFNEAVALDFAVGGGVAPRPMTHDLVLNVIRDLGAVLERALVVKLEKDTFYGALELRTADGRIVRVDSRPSDAIVIATKKRAPIYVEEQVLQEVSRHQQQMASDADADATEPDDMDDDSPF